MSKRPAKGSRASSGLVYSTDGGRQCPSCRHTIAACRCERGSLIVDRSDPGDGVVRLHLERKGRKGKGVTLVRGLALSDADLALLARHLKSSLGVGGAVKNAVVEVQSIDREKIRALLVAKGHTVKLAGG